jgi:hypothetical protein
MNELNSYLQNASLVSDRVRTTLRISFIVCEDDLLEIERRAAKVNRGVSGRLNILTRVKHVWSAEAVTECERRLNMQVDMMKRYIELVRL